MTVRQDNKKYLDYIRATNCVPLPIATFDNDWQPIGPLVRKALVAGGLVKEHNGGIKIVKKKGPK